MILISKTKRLMRHVIPLWILPLFLFPQLPAARQLPAEPEPADVALMKALTQKVYKNKRGCWEAELTFGIKMVYIPAGEFIMGAQKSEPDRSEGERPRHRVYLDGYWIGKFEVTHTLWKEVTGRERIDVKGASADMPVAKISLHDALSFIRILNAKTGFDFSLPTEAQWEKACRGGSDRFRYGRLEDVAWYAGNSGGRPHPVGRKKANNFGIYDMLGNVWEWCSDWYAEDYYKVSPYKNPGGPVSGKSRVMRGGCFTRIKSYQRCAHRNANIPSRGRKHHGFRLMKPAGI
ncbi:MAG: formylglycine-generating enzyme family protein [bacterium]|nr:formylglycine-generating enzyme family protein [bacterium]